MDVDSSYTELGLTAQATDSEVKAAWRRLAARWHPDRNRSPTALRKIQRINRAVEEIRRARRMTAPSNDGDSGPAAGERTEPETRANPRRTLHHTVRVTLEDALAGCVKDVQGDLVEDCDECGATGQRVRAGGCPTCAGAGELRRPLWFVWGSVDVECTACHGDGTARTACAACEGTGKAPPRKYRCRVRIPAGARDGDMLDIEHAPVDGGRKEILRVHVELEPHEIFQLEPDGTVKCEVPVDGFAWTGNRWIDIPTPTGLQQMRLKRGHLVYRIKGQGFPSRPDGARADCMVTVVPLFPGEFSSKQEAQLDRLIEANTGAAGTDAGKGASAWKKTLRRWAATLPS